VKPHSIFDVNPVSLAYLLASIQQREIALPDFQRDFVWDPRATEELIESLCLRFPAGSLLRIKNGAGFAFAPREFAGAPPLGGHAPSYLILDGQQRLTSLYQAFHGTGSHRYFLDLGGLLAGKDLEDCVFHLRQKEATKRYGDAEKQAAALVFPLADLFGGKHGFEGWLDRVLDRRPETGDAKTELKQRLRDLRERWVAPIEGYEFPMVTLAETTSAEAVCTIFETLNRTGVKLSVFDLLAARFWVEDVRLRNLWDDARRELPVIEDFDVDPYYVLQAIAIHTAKGAPACKRGDVLALTVDQIRAGWEPVVRGLAEALALLQGECGVVIPRWMPYTPMWVPMAALFAVKPDRGPAVGDFRQKLLRWYWCSVFGQSYDNPPNSQSVKDYVEFRRWLGGGEPPESVARFAFDASLLRSITPRQRALYRGAITLVLRSRSRDFHEGAVITAKLIAEEQIDDHHLFPKAWLAKHRPETSEADRECVLNRTLIDRITNIRIGDRAPSDYLAEIEAKLGAEPLARILGSHRVPAVGSREAATLCQRSEADARRILDELRNRGLIDRIGEGRARKYVLGAVAYGGLGLAGARPLDLGMSERTFEGLLIDELERRSEAGLTPREIREWSRYGRSQTSRLLAGLVERRVIVSSGLRGRGARYWHPRFAAGKWVKNKKII